LTFSSIRRLSVEWALPSSYERGDRIWYFPGSHFVAVLRPKLDNFWQRSTGERWIFLHTSPLAVPGYDTAVWATIVAELIQIGDYARLLAIDGLNKEVIEIH
jgi:hypothetical protein